MTVSALGFSSFNNDSAAAASSSSTMSKYRRKTSSSSSSPAAVASAAARNTTNKNYGGANASSSPPLSSSAGSTSLQFSTYLSSSSPSLSLSSQDAVDGNQPLDPSQKNTATSSSTNTNFRQLIEKVARVNLESAGDGLASFQPLGYAKSAFLENKENFEPLSSTDTTDATAATAPPAVFGPPLLPLIPRSTDNERERRQFIPSSPGTTTTNYATSYLNQVRTSMADSAALAAADNSSSSSASAKILEKLNYMIFLLEEQQNQRTNNVTEEFIMYLFLGIFMIFLVDCFHRRP